MRDEHSSSKPWPCRVGADPEERTALLPIHASDSLRTESGGYGNERAIQICTAHTTEAQGSYMSPRLRWCRRRDLNPHGLRHTPLKRACLPFHHFGTQQKLENPRNCVLASLKPSTYPTVRLGLSLATALLQEFLKLLQLRALKLTVTFVRVAFHISQPTNDQPEGAAL